jgi:hypothetical protein
MSFENLFLMLAYGLFLSVISAAAYKHCRGCDPAEVAINVFFMFMVILLIVMIAFLLNMKLLAALGIAAIFGLMAYYATVEEEPTAEQE